MTVKLLTEHHLEFQSLIGGCTCQNVTLLEITCHGSFVLLLQGTHRLYSVQIVCLDSVEHAVMFQNLYTAGPCGVNCASVDRQVKQLY